MTTLLTSTRTGKIAKRHLSQLHGTVEPLLQLGLDLPAVLVDVDQVRQRQQQRQ